MHVPFIHSFNESGTKSVAIPGLPWTAPWVQNGLIHEWQAFAAGTLDSLAGLNNSSSIYSQAYRYIVFYMTDHGISNVALLPLIGQHSDG